MVDVAPLSGGWPTLSELRSASFQHLGQFADWCDQIANKTHSAFEEVAKEVHAPGGVEWEGAVADAAIDRAAMDLVKVRGWAWGHQDVAGIARRGKERLEAGQREALDAVDEAERDGFDVGEDYRVADARGMSSRAEMIQRQTQAEAHSNFIRHRVGHLVANDRTITAQLNEATADFGNLVFEETPTTSDANRTGRVQAVDNKTHKDAPENMGSEADRRQNQIDAFKQVYGREPVSANDWGMAAALDPHSYDPKYQGVPPEIVAGRFTPQPGKGVVRSNMFIPTDQVQNIFKDPTDIKDGRYLPKNFGDNRGPSATADVEASRVSVFVDYDHGVIVVRQNPTVNVDGARGGAAADVPNVHVVQAPDGRMTIDYNAHDAYENPLGTAAGVSVNGRITLEPHADGTVSLAATPPSTRAWRLTSTGTAARLRSCNGTRRTPAVRLVLLPVLSAITGSGTPRSRRCAPTCQAGCGSWRTPTRFQGDPFLSHTTQLTNPFQGGIPTVVVGR
jgi:hypothetical protein